MEVTREVEEVIFINLPMKPLCSPDCRVASSLWANRNKEKCFCEEAIDPRLAVLKKNWAKENL